MKNKTEQIEGTKLEQKDWDNFKSLKEFIEAEKLSNQLQKKIHDFHESFLISKSHTIEELATMPNINWLYVEKYLRWRDSDRGGYHYWNKGEYKISLVPFIIRTKRIKRAYANSFIPDDFEKSIYSLLDSTIVFIEYTKKYSFEPIFKTIESAEIACKKYNDLLRDKILEFVLYQKQGEQRFILNNKNNPITIHTNGCLFDIDEEKNQLYVGTSSIVTECLYINGHGKDTRINYRTTRVYRPLKLVFDISTNNLLDVVFENQEKIYEH